MRTAPLLLAGWTYAVIDRQGRVHALGIQPDYVEKVLDALLEE